ncbi:uncharacterized protein LOC115734162 isoform X2 [Rhodamnia argentea]|uniref:Uncharacterized protein LOC115734162 isoform X2 n=1 Tax=Rhodamnia argentea TaxID=178133 RepID=A0ABM3HH25_9MYRT|nr:uncharacterized protein LOC115734162 isoform X2 [Rhodamnia argentea]
MEPDRLNSPDTSVITIDILGHQLQFGQEKNSRRGKFCPSKLKGKRVIELGAGCGVAGFGMALLGCDVVTTDQAEVLPLLRRNVERNTSRILQMNPDSFGSIQVAELDWGNMEHINAVDPPFDFIIGTDVVYSEHLLEPLLETICALSGPRTCILLGYEMRSTSVHEQMMQMWKRSFDLKPIPKSKMHTKYQHPSIQLFMMGSKSMEKSTGESTRRAESTDETAQSIGTSDERTRYNEKLSEDNSAGPQMDSGDNNVPDDPASERFKDDVELLEKLKNGDLSEWEARRNNLTSSRNWFIEVLVDQSTCSKLMMHLSTFVVKVLGGGCDNDLVTNCQWFSQDGDSYRGATQIFMNFKLFTEATRRRKPD